MNEAISTPYALQQNTFVRFFQETDVMPSHSSASPEDEPEGEMSEIDSPTTPDAQA